MLRSRTENALQMAAKVTFSFDLSLTTGFVIYYTLVKQASLTVRCWLSPFNVTEFILACK